MVAGTFYTLLRISSPDFAYFARVTLLHSSSQELWPLRHTFA